MRLPTKAIALPAALLVITALSAAQAQALEYRLESGTGLSGETFTMKNEGSTTISGPKGGEPSVTCTSFTASGTIGPGGTTSGVVFEYSACVPKDKKCTVSSPPKTSKLKTTASEGTGVTYTNFQPESGKTFLEISFGGAECEWLGKRPLAGSACWVGSAKGVYEVEQRLVSPALNCPSTLSWGAFAGELNSVALASLTGGNAGKKWGLN